MKLKLSLWLMRMAVRVLRPGPLTRRNPMDDEAVRMALCVPPEHPVYRAVLELMHRHAEAAQREAYAERNAARNPIKTTYYVASAGTSADLIDYVESARLAAMAGRMPGQV